MNKAGRYTSYQALGSASESGAAPVVHPYPILERIVETNREDLILARIDFLRRERDAKGRLRSVRLDLLRVILVGRDHIGQVELNLLRQVKPYA